MNQLSQRLAVLAIAATAAGIRAQEEASTLSALAARADVVAVATATAATDPSPEWHRLEFRTEAALHGSPPATFALLEPAGRCCGRALFQLVPGTEYLLFLERRGPLLHPIAGDRGVVLATADVITHVRALAASADPAARARVLAGGLDAATPRIRDDAALALGALPGLGTDAFVRARVHQALAAQLPMPTTRLPALTAAAVRCGDDAAALLLPYYLATADADTERVLQRALLQVPAAALGAAIAVAAPATDDARVRALELLAAAPAVENLPLVDQLLAGATAPRVALAASEALLAAGRDPSTLTTRVPRAVLELARQRRAALPRFRAVRPGSQP